MSYRCTLLADKNIKKEDIDVIIDNLPNNLCSPFGNSKQSWGWSCACDVYNPVENKLDIGGAYSISGHIANKFIDYITNELSSKGYIITKEWDD